MRAVVGLIRDDEGRYLSVWNRRYQGWGLPGGKVESGEEIRPALDRELLEETSITIHEAVEVYVGEWPSNSTGALRIVHVWDITSFTGDPRETEPNCPVEWLTKEDLCDVSPFREFYREMFRSLA